MSSLVCTALALMMAAVGPTGGSNNPTLERAKQAYADARWDEAATAFGQAYEAQPRPEFLYAKAQAERLGGHCEMAVQTYRAFIETEPPPEAVTDAEQNLARCQAELAESDPLIEPAAEAEARADPGAPPVPVRPAATDASADPDADAPSKSAERSRPWYRDPWGGVLTATGVAAAGVGAGLLAEAHRRQRHARDVVGEGAYAERIEGAPVLSRVGIGLLAAGGALVLGGIVRYALEARRNQATRTDRQTWAPGRPTGLIVLRW